MLFLAPHLQKRQFGLFLLPLRPPSSHHVRSNPGDKTEDILAFHDISIQLDGAQDLETLSLQIRNAVKSQTKALIRDVKGMLCSSETNLLRFYGGTDNGITQTVFFTGSALSHLTLLRPLSGKPPIPLPYIIWYNRLNNTLILCQILLWCSDFNNMGSFLFVHSKTQTWHLLKDTWDFWVQHLNNVSSIILSHRPWQNDTSMLACAPFNLLSMFEWEWDDESSSQLIDSSNLIAMSDKLCKNIFNFVTNWSSKLSLYRTWTKKMFEFLLCCEASFSSLVISICPPLPFTPPVCQPKRSYWGEMTANSWANMRWNSHYSKSPFGNNTTAYCQKSTCPVVPPSKPGPQWRRDCRRLRGFKRETYWGWHFRIITSGLWK